MHNTRGYCGIYCAQVVGEHPEEFEVGEDQPLVEMVKDYCQAPSEVWDKKGTGYCLRHYRRED